MNNHNILRLLVVITLFLLPACQSNTNAGIGTFTEPDPETYVSLMPVIREYFYLRKQAVLTGDLTQLYTRFPELEVGSDIEHGINTEASRIAGMQSLAPFDGNIHPEYYEPIKIKRSGTQVQVLVHGMELYLWKDTEGVFNESGGEFKIVLYLRQAGDGWLIYRTDEVTLQEWKDFES